MNQEPQPLNIAIIGAGSAGLIIAIALKIHDQTNHQFTVLEKYPALKLIGGSASIKPNATRLLIGLDLRDEIEQ